MKTHNLTTKTAGFTLVEVLVSITILLLVITGPMRVIVRANNSTAYSTEQVTAFFLAQEGLELVEKGRDDALLAQFSEDYFAGPAAPNPGPWDAFKSTFSACTAATGCGVSWQVTGTDDTVAVKSCPTATDCRLYQSATTSTARDRYTYTTSGTTQTLYTRTIRMAPVTGGPGGRDRGMIATSTVEWRTGSLVAGQKVEIVTYLTNVYDTP